MSSELANCLAKTTSQFNFKRSTITLNAGTNAKMLEFNPLRIYFAVPNLSSGGGSLYPIKFDANESGYASPFGADSMEFWVEKHKALVSYEWWLSSLGNFTYTIYELSYQG